MTDNIRWITNNDRAIDLVQQKEKRELRSKKIQSCGICGVRTNKWAIMYWMGFPSIRLYCQYWNDTGTSKVNLAHTRLQKLQERLDGDALTVREVADVQAEISELRAYFTKFHEDVLL